MDESNLILYKTEDEEVTIDVIMQDETVWLSLDQMADLFDRNKSTISRHIKNVFDEGELQRQLLLTVFTLFRSGRLLLGNLLKSARIGILNER